MKLSKNQIKVMRLMQEGWELGSLSVLVEHAWLQKNGIGYGDPIEDTKIVTVKALIRKGLIERLPSRSPMINGYRYRLTRKGEELEL